jgi:ATP-binding cassette subfamily B protein
MRLLNIYRRVFAMLGNDRRLAGFLLTGNLVVAGLQFLDPVLFGRVIGLLTHSATLDHASVWAQAATLLGLWGVVGAIGIGVNILVALHAERLAHRSRLRGMERFFSHALALPLSFHGEVHSGRLMRNMQMAAEALFGANLLLFRDQAATFLSVIVLLPLTLFLNWRLALVLIALVILSCIVTGAVIGHTQNAQRRVEVYQSALAAQSQDAFSNLLVVQSFSRLPAEVANFRRLIGEMIAAQFPVLNWFAIVNVLTRAASTLAVITIVLIGTLLHLRGQAEVGQIVAFMGFATLLIGRLEQASAFVARMFFQLPALEAYFDVLDVNTSVPDRVGAKPLVVSRGEVVFDQVSFTYPNGPRVLSDISFTAYPGMSVALVGHTGAGKSTVAAVLQRFWDPESGRVMIDGQDLRGVTLRSLRDHIGTVFQDSMLFNRSIRDNLLVGRPDATEAEIEQACRVADAHDFIMAQPDGYDTMVGERGSTLSGGQKQRLAIARALLKDAPLLILDEATSALDGATEARVSLALKRLMAGRTTFIIAHRLSTVRDADMVLVFENGRIVEHGKFDALLTDGGHFADLVSAQMTTAVHAEAAD